MYAQDTGGLGTILDDAQKYIDAAKQGYNAVQDVYGGDKQVVVVPTVQGAMKSPNTKYLIYGAVALVLYFAFFRRR